MSLERYRKKRHFGATPEPRGEVKEKGQHRFVVQKHQSSHLHYDFRLEMGGVLRSWAVPKGPPLEAGVRRLAVQVEDHPIDYINFAGEIPEGEYGAGIVEIWDKGKFYLEKKDADRLEFYLKGEKLLGRYVLIHTGGNYWLLLKRKQSVSDALSKQR